MTGSDGDRQRVSVAEHREDVVRRLLERGLSPDVIRLLTPELGPTLEAVAATATAPPQASITAPSSTM